MKEIFLIVAGILVAMILAVVVIGLIIPEQHQASRMLKTKQAPQVIWDTINDHANEASWRDDIANVASVGERNGKPVSGSM